MFLVEGGEVDEEELLLLDGGGTVCVPELPLFGGT